MADFTDLGAFLAPTLDLPVGGTVYRIPSPPALVGLRLRAAYHVDAARREQRDPNPADVALVAAEENPRPLAEELLGPVYDQLVQEQPLAAVQAVTTTVYAWVVGGEQSARSVWRSLLGEATSPVPAASTSTSGAAENGTPTPGSTSGTTSPTTSGKRSKRPRTGPA